MNTFINQLASLSEEKQKLLRECLDAIVFADQQEIEKIQKDFRESNAGLEETCDIQGPTIKIYVSGLGNTLFLNGKSCFNENDLSSI